MTTQTLRQPTPAQAAQSSHASAFRGDIQGLRALAVLSVALDHAHIPGFSGGFVGVDVFFVISGYLITQLLVREVQQTGRISLANFYARRAKRILPAATLVLGVTVIASALMLGYVRASAVIKDSIWSAFFAANIKFSRDETDYFAADNPPSPLQHFWSLAVEEQFYLVWPVLLVAVVFGVRALRRRQRAAAGLPEPEPFWPARLVVLILVVLGGISLAWSISLTKSSPTSAYFSTPARAWELAIGALVAVLTVTIARLHPAVRAAAGWIGVAAVLTAIFTYDAQTPFPGSAAVMPVVGTALIIASGTGLTRGGPQFAFDHPVGRRIGDWSYSLYLWHWPVLVIAAGYAGHSLPVLVNVLLLIGALALSAATYYWIENPWRRSRMLSAKVLRGLLVYPLGVAVTLACCFGADRIVQNEIDAAASVPGITVDDFDGNGHEPGDGLSTDPAVALVQASVAAARDDQAIPGQLSPSLLDLVGDIADVGDCDYERSAHVLCERGDVGSDHVLVAMGDSHARAWIPALEKIAKREGYATYYLVKQGCNAGQITPDLGNGPFEGCVDWRQWAISQVKDLQPDVLFLANDVPPGIVDSSGNTTTDPEKLASLFGQGLEGTIDELRNSVDHVVVVGDVPGVPETPGDCLSQRDANLGDCAFPRSEWSVMKDEAAHQAADATGSTFVNPVPWFCAAGLCPSVVGSTVTYRDTEHITTTYSAELAGPLQTAMDLPPMS